MTSIKKQLSLAIFSLLTAVAAPASNTQSTLLMTDAQQWVEDMKNRRLGPFERLVWYCNDGSIRPPRAFACRGRGGGRQHGKWSNNTKYLRSEGFFVGNVLAAIDPHHLAAQTHDRQELGWLVLEPFLASFDDGWIFRQSRFVRGLYQAEDESKAAEKLLLRMAEQNYWRTDGLLLWRELIKALPYGSNALLVNEVRVGAVRIANSDRGFTQLRVKIHGQLELADADRVDDYARQLPRRRRAPYQRLASQIRQLFAGAPMDKALRAAARHSATRTEGNALRRFAREITQATDPKAKLAVIADASLQLRHSIANANTRKRALDMAEISLQLEAEAFRLARVELSTSLGTTRRQHVDVLHQLAKVAHGVGLVTAQELAQTETHLAVLQQSQISLHQYRQVLHNLSLVPSWAEQRIRFAFGGALEKGAELTHSAQQYVPDRLRASPLLPFGDLLAVLHSDADQLAGIKHRLLDEQIHVGLRSLNPGIARGRLLTATEQGQHNSNGELAIYLVPETVADLPPVAGILTQAAGNPLSHVQLLARNLGIPNVVVAEQWLPKLQQYAGQELFFAASPAGVVQILPLADAPASLLDNNADIATRIEPDLQKLDLQTRSILDVSQLTSQHSGVWVGPKAAKLGELHQRFPGSVSPALALPFGLYRELLDSAPYQGGEQSLGDWMRERYRYLAKLKTSDQAAYHRELPQILAQIRSAVTHVPISPAWREYLRGQLAQFFGPDGSYGVFVRSDTNVEDLPGFTGAGLNKTVPNAVGFDNILMAIKQVWASPFTARAFGWRQGVMDSPEHVYASVLLHKTVAADKSGVLITADVDTGNHRILTVVANEGVGGGVDGQAAEVLKIPLGQAPVQRLASATASHHKRVNPAGGIFRQPAQAPTELLLPAEIEQLRQLARDLPKRFPEIVNAAGEKVPADIEFGFANGKLHLFQIRPFLDSKKAKTSRYLQQLDKPLQQSANNMVRLDEPAIGSRISVANSW